MSTALFTRWNDVYASLSHYATDQLTTSSCPPLTGSLIRALKFESPFKLPEGQAKETVRDRLVDLVRQWRYMNARSVETRHSCHISLRESPFSVKRAASREPLTLPGLVKALECISYNAVSTSWYDQFVRNTESDFAESAAILENIINTISMHIVHDTPEYWEAPWL